MYPPPYGAPYGQPPAPAGLGGLFEKWKRIVTHPSAASFSQELPTANWGDIWLSIIALGVLTAITGFIGGLEGSGMAATFANMNNLPPADQQLFQQMSRSAPLFSFGSIIWIPLSFFIGVGILFVIAKIFGGTGSFLQQAYAFALFTVPVNAASAILGLVPVLGGLAAAALSIYSIFLAVFAVSASQRLTTGKSVAVVLLPAAIIFVLACLAVVLLAAVIAASLPHQ